MNSTETSILRASSSAATSSSSPAVRSPQATITPLRRIFANAGGNTLGSDGGDLHHSQLTCSTHTGEGLSPSQPTNALSTESAALLGGASPRAPTSNFQSPLTSPRDSSQAVVDTIAAPKVVDSAKTITSATEQRDSEGRDDVSPASLSSSLSTSLNEKLRVESDSKGDRFAEDGEVRECPREGLVHERPDYTSSVRADAQAEAERALRRFFIPAAHIERDCFPTSTSERNAQNSYQTPFQIDGRLSNRNDTTTANRIIVPKSGSNSGGVARPASSCTVPTQSVASSSLCVSSTFPQAASPPLGASTAHETAILAVNDVTVLQSLLLRSVARQQALEQVVQSLIEGRRGLLVHSLKLRDERDKLRTDSEQMAEELRAMKTACTERYAAAECKVHETAAVPFPSAEPVAKVVSGETSETNRCDVNGESGATVDASPRTARTSCSKALLKCEDGPLSASVSKGNDSVGVDAVHIDPCPHSQPPARSQLRSPRHNRVLNTTSQYRTTEPSLATSSGAGAGGRTISKLRADTGVGYSEEPAAVVADESESCAEDSLTATIPTAAPRSLSTPPEVPLADSVLRSNPLVHQKGGLSKRDEHETREKKKNGAPVIVADSSLGVSEKGKLAKRSQNEANAGPLPKGLSKAHTPRLLSGGVKQKMVAPVSSLANVETTIAARPKPRGVAVAGNKPIGTGGEDAADDDVYGDARGASTHSCVPSSSASTATGSANVGARARITPFIKPKKSLAATAPMGTGGHSANAPDLPVRKAVSPSRRVALLNANKRTTVADGGQTAVADVNVLKGGGEVGNLKDEDDVRGSDRLAEDINGSLKVAQHAEDVHDGFCEQQQQQQQEGSECAPSPNRVDLSTQPLESQRTNETDTYDPNADGEDDSKEANYLRRQSASLSPSRRAPTARAPQRVSEGAGDGGGLNASEGTVGHSNNAALVPNMNKSQHVQLSHSQRRASPLGAMRRVMASVATGGSSAPSAATNQHPPRRGVGASGFIPGRSASPLPVATGSALSTSVPQTVVSSTRVAAAGPSGVPSSLKSSTSYPTATNTGVNATAPHSSHQSGNRGTVVVNTAFSSSQARPPVVAALSREKMALATSSSVGAATTGRTNVSTPNLTSRTRKRTPDRGAITNRTATQMCSGPASGVVGSTPPIPSKLGAITPNAGGGKAPKNTPATTLPSGD